MYLERYRCTRKCVCMYVYIDAPLRWDSPGTCLSICLLCERSCPNAETVSSCTNNDTCPSPSRQQILL